MIFRTFKILFFGALACGLIYVATKVLFMKTDEEWGFFYNLWVSLAFYVIAIFSANFCFNNIQNFNKPKDAPEENIIFDAVFYPAIKYLSRKNFKPKKGTPEQEAKSAKNLEVLKWILIIIFFVAYGLAAYRNVLG